MTIARIRSTTSLARRASLPTLSMASTAASVLVGVLASQRIEASQLMTTAASG